MQMYLPCRLPDSEHVKVRDEEPEKAYDGKDLVLVNPVALEGSLRVLHEKEVEIRERFVPVFLQKLLDSRGTSVCRKKQSEKQKNIMRILSSR